MLELLLVLTLINTGVLAFQLLGPQRWRLKRLSKGEPESRKRPFTVTLATESGASARDVFLGATLKTGETMEFCENGVRRDLREGE